MDRDINILFPLQYDWNQEVQCLISFITDWVDTQQLYNSAFGIVDFSADTDVVNPLDLSISGTPLSNNDFVEMEYHEMLFRLETEHSDKELYQIIAQSRPVQMISY